jgi:hypothetical protein
MKIFCGMYGCVEHTIHVSGVMLSCDWLHIVGLVLMIMN